MSISVVDLYQGPHQHPSISSWVEIVAYKRQDDIWEVFIFEPKGSLPELEVHRIDDDHIFFKTIEDIAEIDPIVREVHDAIGPGYELLPFFQERSSRKWIGKIYDHLRKAGRTGMAVKESKKGVWEIMIRKKDFSLASEVISSNIPED